MAARGVGWAVIIPAVIVRTETVRAAVVYAATIQAVIMMLAAASDAPGEPAMWAAID